MIDAELHDMLTRTADSVAPSPSPQHVLRLVHRRRRQRAAARIGAAAAAVVAAGVVAVALQPHATTVHTVPAAPPSQPAPTAVAPSNSTAGTVPPATAPPSTAPPSTAPPSTAPATTAPPSTAPPSTAPAIDRGIGVEADCNVPGSGLSVTPDHIVLACGDGNAELTGLHWTSWTATSATATGSYRHNDCVPDCADGHFVNVAGATVRLDHPVATAGGEAWSEISYTAPGQPPVSEQPLPTHAS